MEPSLVACFTITVTYFPWACPSPNASRPPLSLRALGSPAADKAGLNRYETWRETGAWVMLAAEHDCS